MNGKEAIKMLRTIERTVCLGNQKFYEAIDVAIKTLDQQPEITYCKDCIFGHPYFDVYNGVVDSWIECQNPDGLNRDVSLDGFCSAGVKARKGERNEQTD